MFQHGEANHDKVDNQIAWIDETSGDRSEATEQVTSGTRGARLGLAGMAVAGLFALTVIGSGGAGAPDAASPPSELADELGHRTGAQLVVDPAEPCDPGIAESAQVSWPTIDRSHEIAEQNRFDALRSSQWPVIDPSVTTAEANRFRALRDLMRNSEPEHAEPALASSIDKGRAAFGAQPRYGRSYSASVAGSLGSTVLSVTGFSTRPIGRVPIPMRPAA